MKRVLHVSKYYFPFRGGTEKIAGDCVNALSGLYEQKVICFNHERGTRTDCVNGVEVVRMGCFAKVASQPLSMGYARRLKHMIGEFAPDVVVFHYPNPFVASFMLRMLPPGAKLVIFWHLDIVKQKRLGRLFYGQNRRLLARCERVIAASPNYAEGSRWLRSARDKCRLIPDSIDARSMAMTPGAEACAKGIRDAWPGKVICLAVGRHTRYKGFDVLIDAARRLDDGFVVLIAGEGEEMPRLKRLAAGCQGIRFLGALDEDELKGCMAATDIFCFPSLTRNEAFGLALLEAMYFAKPAVTFTIPDSGVNYVCLNGEDGIEVPNGDAEAYAAALKRLAADPELRRKMGENGRRRVEEHFMYGRFEAGIRALFNEITRET